MTSHIHRVAVAAAVLIGGSAALGSACSPETRCDYIDREVLDSGNPTQDDVSYCWQGLDLVGLYAFRLEPSVDPDAGAPNVAYIVNPPSSIEPAGREIIAAWTLDETVPGGAGTVSVLDIPFMEFNSQVQVTTTSMILGTPGVTPTAPLRRAICTGFGFETPAKKCRGDPQRAP